MPQDAQDPNPTQFPAFMGYGMGSDGPFWRVCAWCVESKGAVEAEARRLGLPVSHGMCQRHHAEQIARITGDQL